jgi:hypothetical protein
MNRFTRALLILALAVGLAGCAPLGAVAPTLAAPTVAAPGQGVASTQAAPTADLAATAGLAATPMPEPDAATTITLGEPIVVQGRGATVQGGPARTPLPPPATAC